MKTTITIPQNLYGKFSSLRRKFSVRATDVEPIYQEDPAVTGCHTPDKLKVEVEYESGEKLFALGYALAKEAEPTNYRAPETLEIEISEDVRKAPYSDKYAIAIKRVKDGKAFFLSPIRTRGKLVFTEEFDDAEFFHCPVTVLIFMERICSLVSSPEQEVLLYSLYEKEGKIINTKVLKISKLDS
jgi:hypothetical protein